MADCFVYLTFFKEKGKSKEDTSEIRNSPNLNRPKLYRKLKLACLLFTGLNLLLSILIGLTVIFLVRDTNAEVFRDTRICVKCSDLVIYPEDTVEQFRKLPDGSCCVTSNENVYDLVNLYAGRWVKKNLAENNSRYSKYKCGNEDTRATIKIMGQPKRQEHTHHLKVLWDSETEMAVIPDAKYMTHHPEHGFIEIKQTGHYFVYSQLVLENANPSTLHNYTGFVSYQHSIHRIGAGLDQKHARCLLSNKDTRCSCIKDKHRFTSHLGSAFQLSAGDRLYVKVNDISEVVPDPVMNHFGVHRL